MSDLCERYLVLVVLEINPGSGNQSAELIPDCNGKGGLYRRVFFAVNAVLMKLNADHSEGCRHALFHYLRNKRHISRHILHKNLSGALTVRNVSVVLRLHTDAGNIIPFRICRFYIYGFGSGGLNGKAVFAAVPRPFDTFRR